MTIIHKTDFLLASYIATIVASELMGSKVFTIFGLVNASVSIFTFPITFMINDVVVEVLGKERAVSFARSGLVILVGLFLFSWVAINLPPATRFIIDPAYKEVFGTSQRIILASLAAYWMSERLDIFIFSKIRSKLGKKRLWLRNNASNFISQLFDTLTFMFLAFYHPGNFWFVLSLTWPYWSVKCLASVFETPLTYLGVKWLKNN